jgi:hypothetical protein
MPILYDIAPQLNLVIYVCADSLTGLKFFETADRAAADSRYSPKMKIIIDILHAEINTSVSDMHLAIEKNKQLKQNGHELGQAAVLTDSPGLNFLADSLRLMSSEAPKDFALFNNRKDIISWMGFLEHEKEINKFWNTLSTNAAKTRRQ